jgi:hypothetical protein
MQAVEALKHRGSPSALLRLCRRDLAQGST